LPGGSSGRGIPDDKSEFVVISGVGKAENMKTTVREVINDDILTKAALSYKAAWYNGESLKLDDKYFLKNFGGLVGLCHKDHPGYLGVFILVWAPIQLKGMEEQFPWQPMIGFWKSFKDLKWAAEVKKAVEMAMPYLHIQYWGRFVEHPALRQLDNTAIYV
jgi:hypothetical protein